MSKSKSWKDNTKDRNKKRYGKRNNLKYQSPFMYLDTRYLDLGKED